MYDIAVGLNNCSKCIKKCILLKCNSLWSRVFICRSHTICACWNILRRLSTGNWPCFLKLYIQSAKQYWVPCAITISFANAYSYMQTERIAQVVTRLRLLCFKQNVFVSLVPHLLTNLLKTQLGDLKLYIYSHCKPQKILV